MNRKEAEARLVEKAGSDPAFRRALLADPTATIARDFNVHFPLGVKVRVLEETARELYLVLPLPAADIPLDDHELDAVSGGRKEQQERVKNLQEEANKLQEQAQSANAATKAG